MGEQSTALVPQLNVLQFGHPFSAPLASGTPWVGTISPRMFWSYWGNGWVIFDAFSWGKKIIKKRLLHSKNDFSQLTWYKKKYLEHAPPRKGFNAAAF